MSVAASTGFFVSVTGELAGAQVPGADDVYCKYSFNYGVDWTVAFGLEHGITQISRKPFATAEKQTFVWNYPIDISFKSTNVFGWPQVVVSVYSISPSGKDIVQGYGSVHIPTTPGRHVRYIRLYKPVSTSWCQRLTSWLTGSPPEFFNSKFVAQGRGREVTRVQSSGVVKLVLNVTTRNMNDFGYQVYGDRSTLNASVNSNLKNVAAASAVAAALPALTTGSMGSTGTGTMVPNVSVTTSGPSSAGPADVATGDSLFGTHKGLLASQSAYLGALGASSTGSGVSSTSYFAQLRPTGVSSSTDSNSKDS